MQKMNLTAVRKPDDVMERHVEDSLAIVLPIQNSYSTYCKGLNDNINVVDVGTGAGLPGIVLAIACPGIVHFPCTMDVLHAIKLVTWCIVLLDWHVTLMESMNKRCIFLKRVVELIGLTNAKVVRGRAEV